METRLSQTERELVAVGASVAAGCIPCTQYHVRAARDAGATTEEITRAVDAALRVKESATAIMRDIAHQALGLATRHAVACSTDPTDRLTALVSVAAAVAVNSPTDFQRLVQTSRALGVRDDEIQFVVGLAKVIRGKATEKMDEAASDRSAAPAPATSCCGPSPCP